MTCSAIIVDRASPGSARRCTRPVVDGGVLCSHHRAAERRREHNEAQRRALREEEQ